MVLQLERRTDSFGCLSYPSTSSTLVRIAIVHNCDDFFCRGRFFRHALEAELRRLKGEIEQRESKTAESFWQRTVAADREKTRLETELDQAQARVSEETSVPASCEVLRFVSRFAFWRKLLRVCAPPDGYI